jgi:probable HAF family extracellular repeat protein
MRNKTPKIVGAACASMLILTASKGIAGCGQGTAGGITNIPTLGGSTINLFSLSSSGAVGGDSTIAGDQVTHAFIFANGVPIDVGTLGGTYGQINALNASNQATGFATTAGDAATHAFFYNGGTPLDLGDLGGGYSEGLAINSAGQVTGDSYNGDGNDHAFLWSGTSMLDLGDLGGGFSQGIAINSSGTITGDTLSSDFNNFAFIYTNGTMTSLGDLGSGVYSSSRGINDSGTIVGESADTNFNIHGFVYLQGKMKDLGTLGGSSSTTVAINNAGQIIGTSFITGDNDQHAFVSDGTTMTDLGTLGGSESDPFAINNQGLIVGQAQTPDFQFHAVIWQNGVITDLNTLIPTNSGWVLSSAQFVNDAGRIVGFGDYNNQFTWFVFDPSSGGSNGVPVAIAGPNQTVDCQTSAFLDGSASSDPNNDTLTYNWAEGNVTLGTNSTLTVSFGLGVHVVTLTVTDPCDASAQTNVTVTVVDNTKPMIVGGPGPLSASADTNCEAAVPSVVGQIVATDNCTPANALSITQDPVAGTKVGLGAHLIIVTVTDASSNSTAGSTSFTVVDTTAPVISSSPAPVTVSAGDNGLGIVPNILDGIVANDSCTPANALTLSQNPTAGSSLGLGSYNIVATVKDAAGNPATANVSLNVVDTTAPVITGTPAPVTVSAGANGLGVVPSVVGGVTATDNCTAANALVITQSPLAGSSLGLGSYSIVVTVKDAAGNPATANVSLNVVDTTAPVITGTPAPVTVSAGANGLGVVPSVVGGVTATDNCTAANALVITQSPLAGSSLGLGSYSIVVTVKDASGNASTTSVAISVIDTTAPVITAPPASPVTVSAGANGLGVVPNVLGGIVASDNCTPANALVITQSPVAGASLGLGSYSVVVTVKDASGNASTATVSLNVVDTTAPVISSVPGPITVSAGANGKGIVPNVLGGVVATDNCTAANALVLGQSLTAGSQLALGTYNIVVTVTDASGNSSTANVTLKVVDTTAPVINSLTASPSVITAKNHTKVPVTVTVSATDNCDPAPVSKIISITANETVAAGDIQITGNLTASLAATRNGTGTGRIYTITVQCTDASGNASTKTVTVTVPH